MIFTFNHISIQQPGQHEINMTENSSFMAV